MRGRPLLALAGFLALGCLLGAEVGAGSARMLLSLAGLLLVLVLLCTREGGAVLGLAGAAVAIGAAGAAVERLEYQAVPLRAWAEREGGRRGPVRVSGVAAGDAAEIHDRYLLTLDVELLRQGREEVPTRGRVRVQVGGSAERPEIGDGDRVSLWATLRSPRGFGTPGAFDTSERARHEGIVAYGHCKSFRLVERGGRAAVSAVRDLASRARAWARRVLRRWIPPGPEEGLVRAMVLGDRTGVDERTAEAFRAAGTYHVLALSGAQVALLAGLLLSTLRWLRLPPIAVAGLVSAALGFYALLVGGDVPVVRAAVMGIVLVLGRAIDLESDMANLLGLAALILLAHRPSNVADVGFQLSFVGTLGLLLLAPPLLDGVARLPLRLEAALLGSLAAQVALLPLLAAHFHRLSPLALPLNLLAVPLAGVVLLAGLGVLFVAALAPFGASLAGEVAWVAGHCLLRSGQLALLTPGLDVRVPSPALLAVGLHLAGVVSLARGARRRAAALLALGVVGLVHGPGPPSGDGRLHLTVLDVGQGDALVLRSPRGRVWLVDAGGAFTGFDAGESVVGPYLWRLGVRRIEALVLTHAHPDHVGGAPFLVRAFGVGEVWEGPAPRGDGAYRVLDEALRKAGATRRTVVRGVRADWDGVAVEVVGPPPGGRPPWRTRNDDSIVLSLRLGEVVFLLTGDVEARGEQRLGVGRAAVVKVPHHGSRSSSSPAFVAASAPRVAVVSVGGRNPFGHPHGEVLERYRRAGAQLLRTDVDGTVSIATDGRALWLRAHRDGPSHRLP